MALSNIFREPRREITETVVGAGIMLTIVGPFAGFAYWFMNATADMGGPPDGLRFFVGLILGALGFTTLRTILSIIHSIGDAACTALEKRGIQMRPRDRRVP